MPLAAIILPKSPTFFSDHTARDVSKWVNYNCSPIFNWNRSHQAVSPIICTSCLLSIYILDSLRHHTFWHKWANPGLIFVYFRSFQTQILQKQL